MGISPLNQGIEALDIVNKVNEVVDNPSVANFIPAGTVYNIKADGTGDFATVSEAVNYLGSKWSNGTVTIKLGAGTFNISSTLTFNGATFNIPLVKLQGNSNTTTILHSTEPTAISIINKAKVSIIGMNITGTSKQNSGVSITGLGIATLDSLIIENFSTGIYVGWQGIGDISTSLTVDNCNNGITAENDSKIMIYPITARLTNLSKGFQLYRFSTICAAAVTWFFSSVTTKTNTTINTFSSNGVFYSDSAL